MGRKGFFIRMAVAYILFLAVMAEPVAVSAADTTHANRMNVVFVMDGSGSMFKTDASSLRFDAMDLFLGLATESGNYMGAVVFDDKIILREDITPIEGLADKNRLSRNVRSVSSDGDTNIGKGIETAVQMLQEFGNVALPSAIILLSDGNTDLGGNETWLQESYASKENAINVARSNGYKIYSVCLNADGRADPAELREISAATGGTSVEVKSAEDLKKVFLQFYGIIYPAEPFLLADIVIPDSGETEIVFRIPRIGVEETNIIISTLNSDTSYMLYQPSGVAYTETELNEMKITAKTFSVLKIQNPADGVWKLIIKGIPGDNVKIEKLYNSDLAIVQAFNSGNTIFADTDVLIEAQLSNAGNLIADDTVYRDYPMHTVITDIATGTSENYEMSANRQRAEYTFRLRQGAEYDVYSYCHIDGLTVMSEVVRIRGERLLPTSAKDLIKIRRVLIPFVKAEYMFPLGSVVSDSVDSSLSYHIVSSDFDGNQVCIEGESLKIQADTIGKGGNLTVEAVNSAGGAIRVAVEITVFDTSPILLVCLAVIVILIAIPIVRKIIREGNQPINGHVMIKPYTEEGEEHPVVCEGIRGKMRLSRCLDIRDGMHISLDRKSTYFFHGEKENYIYLISKNGYYTEGDSDRKNKKIRLEAEIEVNVSGSSEFVSGMKVKYVPDSRNY